MRDHAFQLGGLVHWLPAKLTVKQMPPAARFKKVAQDATLRMAQAYMELLYFRKYGAETFLDPAEFKFELKKLRSEVRGMLVIYRIIVGDADWKPTSDWARGVVTVHEGHPLLKHYTLKQIEDLARS